MKKLMIVMVAGLLVTATYATNVKWGMLSDTGLGATMSGSAIYLVYDASGAGTSYLAALSGKTGSYSTSDITGTLVTGGAGTLDSNGFYSNTTGVTITPDTISTTKGYKSFYLVAISTDGKTLSYTTTDKSLNIQTSALSATSYWDGTSGFATITVAVPEPTAMALLMMGVALIGLRRRVR